MFHFKLGVFFLIFQYAQIFRKFSNANVRFVAKISCVVSESVIVVSAVLKYFLSGLLGADTNALYTIFTIKHLLLSDHAALFLQLHPWLLEVRYSRQ